MTSVLSRRSTATSKKRWRVARGAWSDTHHCPKVSLTLLGLAKKARKRLKKKKRTPSRGGRRETKGSLTRSESYWEQPKKKVWWRIEGAG